MAVRSTMSELITRVSLYINDPTNATFTTQQVQDQLDRTTQVVRYELLTPAPDIVPQAAGSPAQFNWATYISRYTDWEADEVLQAGSKSSVNWAVLTTTTADHQRGIWTFDVVLPTIASDIPAQLPPVFITGHVYDPYLAAAELLELWAAQLTDAFDFTSDGQTFHRSQRAAAKIKLASIYRRQAKPTTAHLYRSDLQTSTTLQPVHLIGESNDFTR